MNTGSNLELLTFNYELVTMRLFIIFTSKQPHMNKLKLTAFVFFTAVILSSCAKDRDTTISNNNINLTSSQVVPAATSSATGRAEISLNFKTNLFNYKITWNGLSSAVTSIHIHGIADVGQPAAIVQNITGFSTATSGSYSGSLPVDNVVVKEDVLISGRYYVDIHTVNNPQGEIRGQLTFGN
jgi:hypothetical protein